MERTQIEWVEDEGPGKPAGWLVTAPGWRQSVYSTLLRALEMSVGAGLLIEISLDADGAEKAADELAVIQQLLR